MTVSAKSGAKVVIPDGAVIENKVKLICLLVYWFNSRDVQSSLVGVYELNDLAWYGYDFYPVQLTQTAAFYVLLNLFW